MGEKKVQMRPEQFDRYRRHLILPEVGATGQRRLLDASVLLIGAGGLGCPTAQYLAAAGVGRIGLVDFDSVDASNLQRQILYGEADLGRLKVEVAKERIRAQNSDVQVDCYPEGLQLENAQRLVNEYDLVIDGSDNFPTRYLVNDACVMAGKANVHGSVFRFEGQASLFEAGGPCYRCLYPEPPPPGMVPSCAEGGVLGVLPGLIALIQATETIKWICGIGESLAGRLLQYNASEMRFIEFRFRKDPDCPLCGASPRIHQLEWLEGYCGMPGQEEKLSYAEISAGDLSGKQRAGEHFLLLDVREKTEFDHARIEGSLLIPLAELESRLTEIVAWKDKPVVVHCHHGGRSAAACQILSQRGFQKLYNLDGGIEAWSLTVDPAVPRY